MAKILICGDSQAGNPGAAMERRLKELGHAVTRISNVGKGPYDYVRLPELWSQYSTAARSEAWALIWLIFGSNDVANQKLEHALAKMKSSVRPKVCLSGPPQYPAAESQARGAAIREVYMRAFGADYFDSYPFTGVERARAKDGLHLTPTGAEAWGLAMAAEAVRRIR